jgi:hypothetical protein
MFYVPTVGIYTDLSTSISIFINRIQHFWGYYESGAQRLRSQSWSSVFISTSYTKSFVWPQKLKGVKSRAGIYAIVLEPVGTSLT